MLSTWTIYCANVGVWEGRLSMLSVLVAAGMNRNMDQFQ